MRSFYETRSFWEPRTGGGVSKKYLKKSKPVSADRNRPRQTRLFALASFLIALSLQLLVHRFLPSFGIFLIFPSFIALNAWKNGVRVGLFSTLIATAAITYFLFLSPAALISPSSHYLTRTLQTLVFIFQGTLMSVLIGALQESFLRTKRFKELAEEGSRAKSLFAETMSHEIRTPLFNLTGLARVLSEDGISTQERRLMVERIEANAQVLERLIDDLLDTSRSDSSYLEIKPARVHLKELTLQVIDSMQVAAARAGTHIEVVQETDLPEEIESDPIRLSQILMNLIENAVKFSLGKVVRVVVRSRYLSERHAKIVFRIEDKGAGINRDLARNLFEDRGEGLGLLLARRLANALHGNVVLVKSGPNQGSVFVFEMEAKVLSREENRSDGKKQCADLQGLRILVVDDSSDNRLLIRRFLSSHGAEVKEASDGAEGISKALSENFDVVLMDIQMPVMDGFEAIRKLRSKAFSNSVIAISAHNKEIDRQKCREVGCDGFLAKPLTPSRLIREIAETCGRVPTLAHQ